MEGKTFSRITHTFIIVCIMLFLYGFRYNTSSKIRQYEDISKYSVSLMKANGSTIDILEKLKSEVVELNSQLFYKKDSVDKLISILQTNSGNRREDGVLSILQVSEKEGSNIDNNGLNLKDNNSQLRKNEETMEEENSEGSSNIVFFALLSLFLTLFGGLMSGLTVGYLSIDELVLELKSMNGTEEEKLQAQIVEPVLSNKHWLLVTLLISNAAAMEALPLCLNQLMSEFLSVLLSVSLVLLFGEIIPQAVCTGPNQIKIAAFLAPFTRYLMLLTSPLSYPIGKILDKVLGTHSKSRFMNSDLKSLIELHTYTALSKLKEQKHNSKEKHHPQHHQARHHKKHTTTKISTLNVGLKQLKTEKTKQGGKSANPFLNTNANKTLNANPMNQPKNNTLKLKDPSEEIHEKDSQAGSEYSSTYELKANAQGTFPINTPDTPLFNRKFSKDSEDKAPALSEEKNNETGKKDYDTECNKSLNKQITLSLKTPIEEPDYNEGHGEYNDDYGLDEDQANLIMSAIDLRNIKCEEIMIPLNETEMIDYDIELKELKNNIETIKYSRLPVYQNGEKSDIIGVLRLKQLIGKDFSSHNSLRDLDVDISEPLLVKPNYKLHVLLKKFQEGKSHMAFVTREVESFLNKFNSPNDMPIILEYPKLLGIITLEDVLEKILQKEIYDEDDYEEIHKIRLKELKQKKKQSKRIEKKRLTLKPTRSITSKSLINEHVNLISKLIKGTIKSKEIKSQEPFTSGEDFGQSEKNRNTTNLSVNASNEGKNFIRKIKRGGSVLNISLNKSISNSERGGLKSSLNVRNSLVLSGIKNKKTDYLNDEENELTTPLL